MLMTCDLAARATCCRLQTASGSKCCSSCMLLWHFTSMEIKLLTSIVKRNKTAQNTLYYTATRMNKNIYIYIHMNSYNNSNSEQQQELTESIKNNEKHKYRLYDCNVTSFKIEQNMQNNIKTKTQQQQQESNSNKHEQTTHVQHGAHI